MQNKTVLFTKYMEMIKQCKKAKQDSEAAYHEVRAFQHKLDAMDEKINGFVLSPFYDPESEEAKRLLADYCNIKAKYNNAHVNYQIMHDNYCKISDDKEEAENLFKSVV